MDPNKSGNNSIAEHKPPSDISLALVQLKSPLIYILLFAAVFTIYLGDYVDSAVILLAVATNTCLGFFQERKAQRGLAALKRILTPTARVIRHGATKTIQAQSIVVGDFVLIKAGDRVPADGVIVEAVHLYVNEAFITGESEPVEKVTDPSSQVFMGSLLTSGRGKFRVTAIGMDTKIGQIATTLDSTENEITPLQQQLNKLASTLAFLVVAISIGIFCLGLIRGENFVTMFSLAVAIAVAAIPEGMAVSLTAILSVGMQRILKRNAIVRRLVSAETLGSVSTLVIDKTGTLTEGIMRVVETKIDNLETAVKSAVFANNLENPIDNALWEWVQGQDHYDPQQMTDNNQRMGEIPFDSTRKFMAVANNQGIWLKGAPEILLRGSTLSEKEKSIWNSTIDDYARKGLRIVGLGYKSADTRLDIDDSSPLSGLTFIGILGISDPVRAGVAEALTICKHAGVDIKVATGDYRLTSETILNQLGIVIQNGTEEILEGSELNDLTIDELTRRVKKVKLFCRVTPEQKLKIVTALQAIGEVVAMTGDGVNDAPAIKKADIGIVVANASDVAKETADLVLLDSNFNTIVSAIEEGRVMFANIQKVVLYLLSDAFTEMILVTLSILTFTPLPLTAIQILWINILSDGFPNLALSVEPKEHDVMHTPPRRRQSPIFDFRMKMMVVVISMAKALLTYIISLSIIQKTHDIPYAQTLVFTIIGMGSLMYVFATRNLSKSILKTNPLKNPWLVGAVIIGFILQLLVIYHPAMIKIFHTKPLHITDWVLVLGVGLVLTLIVECMKLILKNFSHRRLPTYH